MEDYACRNGFPNPTHFTDDGISGTRFDRPGFTAMMEQVEAGRVGTIIIKDMGRLGRDYLKVGQIMEVKKINGFLIVRFNDRERRERPGLGAFGVIDTELYTGQISIDLDAMEYNDLNLKQTAFKIYRY